MRKLPVVVALCLLPLAACRGCDGRDEASSRSAAEQRPLASGNGGAVQASTTSPSTVPLPKGPWSDLARRLVDAKDLSAAVGATREILARGGVGTFNGERTLVEATGPAARFLATPLETVRLAMEARRRRNVGRLTAAELGQMLASFGWPFKGGADVARRVSGSQVPRSQLAEDMQEAMRGARRSDQDAENQAEQAADETSEAQRQAAMQREAELIRKIQEATLQWQKARQGVAKAPPEGKAAAEAQLQQALAARNALIEERRLAQEQARNAQREQRDRTVAVREDAVRAERIRRYIGPNYQAGEQLMEMFAIWVRQAAENPDDPRSFTPLFLAEMARLQDPPLDLAGSRFIRPGRGDGAPVDLRGAPRSQQYHLTLLELELIAAAFYRSPGTARAVMPAGGDRAGGVAHAFADTGAGIQEPCSDIKKTLGDLGGEVAGIVGSEAVGAALERAVQAATSADDAAAFGKAMSAIGIAAKIGKLVSFYSDNQVTVTASPTSTHKPPQGTPLVTYTATAGISEEDWKEYERLMTAESAKVDQGIRDCFQTLGLPTAPEVADLAKEAEDWLVEWRLVEGSPPHAWISLKNNTFYVYGRLAMKLARSGPYSASAKLVVDILPEPANAHPGKTVRTYVTARAAVDAAGMPSLGTLIGAMKGLLGLAESLLEICIGWYQVMNMPKAYGTVEVEYHCPRPTTLHPTDTPVADGGGGEGPADCLLEPDKAR